MSGFAEGSTLLDTLPDRGRTEEEMEVEAKQNDGKSLHERSEEDGEEGRVKRSRTNINYNDISARTTRDYKTVEYKLPSPKVDPKLASDMGNSTPNDRTKAANKLWKSGKVLAAANLLHPQALGEMASNYANGFNEFEEDHDKAFDFATKSANLENETGMWMLAICYDNGLGTPKNSEKALEWYQRCKDEYYGQAQCNIGDIYFKGGNGVKQDYKSAFNCLKESVAKDFIFAVFPLGNMYFYGYGVRQSFAEARRLYRIAADDGNDDALYALGRMTIKKQGSSKQGVTAGSEGMHMIEQACAMGNAAAEDYLARFMEFNTKY